VALGNGRRTGLLRRVLTRRLPGRTSVVATGDHTLRVIPVEDRRPGQCRDFDRRPSGASLVDPRLPTVELTGLEPGVRRHPRWKLAVTPSSSSIGAMPSAGSRSSTVQASPRRRCGNRTSALNIEQHIVVSTSATSPTFMEMEFVCCIDQAVRRTDDLDDHRRRIDPPIGPANARRTSSTSTVLPSRKRTCEW
jgi:hypothetical protein